MGYFAFRASPWDLSVSSRRRGLDGCEVHVLFAAAEGAPAALYGESRG